MFENKQGINEIKLYGRFHGSCPMGNAWYSADVEITVSDPVTIPDYMDVDRFIHSLDGQSLIIEDLTTKVFDFMKEQTNGTVTVSSESSDGAHLAVKVTKEG